MNLENYSSFFTVKGDLVPTDEKLYAKYFDVEEGYFDPWEMEELEEFGYDNETYLYEFNPFVEYFELKNSQDVVVMTYQSLLELAEMISQLLHAWMERRLSRPENNDMDPTKVFCNPFGLSFYQMDYHERDACKNYSVEKLLRVFGGDNEILIFKKEVDQIVKFLKTCLLHILESCFPFPLPYPVLSSILSKLLTEKGVLKIGYVLKQKAQVEVGVEADYMEKLYLKMADVYDHLKVIMFNIEPNTHSSEPPLREKNVSLIESYNCLNDIVTRFGDIAQLSDMCNEEVEEKDGNCNSIFDVNGNNLESSQKTIKSHPRQ